MADPEQRERESQDEATTKFEQEREQERADVERAAGELGDPPPAERDD